MGRLNLADCPKTLIWKAIVDRIRSDATLSAAGLEAILAWEDTDGDNRELDDFQGAALRLTPQLGAMTWLFEATQSGALVVAVEASLPGMDATDFLNLQHAIEGALYPDDANAWINSLVILGAETGLIEFIAPLSEDPSTAGSDGKWRPMGTFKINVRRELQ